MKKKTRSLALLMIFVLLFSSVSFAVSAESAPVAETLVRVSEVESLRETNSETYLLSDGTYECVVYAYDKYYKTADNTLQLTSSKIVPAGTSRSGKTQYKNAANAFDVYFSGSGTPEISLAFQGAAVTFSPITSGRNTTAFFLGKVSGCKTLNTLTSTGDNTVTYSDAFPGADLVYVLDNNALKEYIILNSSTAGNTFSFRFSLDGVKLEAKDTYADFVDENGSVLFSLDSLFAVDANGAFTDDLTYTFTSEKDTNEVTVTVTLDKEYFSSSDRVFPIIIDPTVMISSTETADACVCSDTPNTNYQLNTRLRTGYDDEYGKRRSFIRFNIPSSITNVTVDAARIEMEKVSGVVPTVRAYMCFSDWSSSTITWNNMPTGGDNYAYASNLCTPYSATSSWYVMDVTNIVTKWVDGIYPNYGFIIRDDNEMNINHWTTWYSSDAASPHKPELHITYTPQVIDTPQVIYSSYQFTHYYDSSISATQKNQILSVVHDVSSAFNRQFQIRFSTKSGPLYDPTLTSQDLDAIRIANQLYTYPRDDNEITVFWTDYEPGNYCMHEGTTHTVYGANGCTQLDVFALVYRYHPVIHFTDLISSDGTDYHYRIAMSLILMHETAHTFGFVENYYDPLHASNGMQCVMEPYPTSDSMGLMLFYEGLMNEDCPAFCTNCYDRLKALLEA